MTGFAALPQPHPALFARLRALVEACGVSGSEAPVARAVQAQLSAASVLARHPWQSDALGNGWLHFGPSGPPQRLLAAHLDEIGLRITSIRPDGLCRLTALGGIDAQLWEGVPVLVHGADGAVPGCIAPVSLHVTQRQGLGPRARLETHELLLDLGCGSVEEVAQLGVAVLDSVTYVKTLHRVGPAGLIVQGRSLDDRFGCTALIELACALAAAAPPVPTVLAWTVQEELGLRGARALAARFAQCREVLAIDSFTVANSPRDNAQFQSAQLGGGPVLRAFDGTTLVPDAARQALARHAQALGVPLQQGYMPGGNDASVFEAGGARVCGLGIPLAYSHSAVEQVHLDDLAGLCRLLAAWCAAPLLEV